MNKILIGIWIFCYSVLVHAGTFDPEDWFLYTLDFRGDVVSMVPVNTRSRCMRVKKASEKINPSTTQKFRCIDVNSD